MSCFALVARAPGIVCINGILAGIGAQRTPETGIRLALGAQPKMCYGQCSAKECACLVCTVDRLAAGLLPVGAASGSGWVPIGGRSESPN